jgi:PBSX family phage terminase large subunit
MAETIIPSYKPVLLDVMTHGHSTYVLAGGRGSTKSSFVGVVIPLLVINFPNVNAVCFRKVGNTIQKSIFAQITWGIYQLGLESLFHIPKTYATPIVYKPTGQQIFFMGLDDPNKIKSVKAPFGYIGITWFEELDQYAGKNELRKVTQSTKRGGDVFWDFRTFNPPISKNNWANEYAEDAEVDSPDTLVVRNTYLDVPREWLGEEFIFEAEELKRKNERAYVHEYLGQAIGTGGDVFPNACKLDMDKPVDQHDSYGNVVKKVPLWATFDRIYNGIDWGFALDPTRFVKLYFDKTRHDIYIYREYTTIKSRSVQIFKELYEKKKLITKNELLTADSGGGGTFVTADFKAFGAYIRQAIKGPDSVEYGIKWLQGLNHIYIDRKHCPETWKEFSTYEYEQDKDGNFISSYPDENNHSIDAVRYALEKYWQRKGN